MKSRPRLCLNESLTEKLEYLAKHYDLERCELIYKLIHDEFHKIKQFRREFDNTPGYLSMGKPTPNSPSFDK